MSHALAVSAFPEISHPSLLHQTSIFALTGEPEHSGKSRLILNPGSVEQSWRDTQPDDDEFERPLSPMIFRTVHEPGRYLDQDVDRSLLDSSPSAPLAAPHCGAQQTVSTKASIAALGLSRHSPTPSYDLLWASSRQIPQRGHLDQHIPPRSSSLPSSHRISICSPSYSMSRSSTPLSLNDDCCSEEMVFAEPNPNDAEYGSAPKRATRSLLGPYAESSSRTTRPSSSFSLVTRPSRYESEFEPFSLMGAGPGFAVTFMPSYRHKPKPKPKIAPHVEAASATHADRSLRIGFKRMRRLATRRSISSLDCFASPDAESRQPPVQESSLLSVRGRSLESVANTVVSTPPGDEEDRRIVAHKVVGDVWELQKVGEVIPALRSLKVSTKLGL